jgi:hypothetical protein
VISSWKGRVSSVAVLALLALALMPGSALAAPGTCDTGIVHDYRADLAELPGVRLAPTGFEPELPFGPDDVHFAPLKQSEGMLINQPGSQIQVGYNLRLPAGPNPPTVDWVVTAKLFRTGARSPRRGRLLRSLRRRIHRPSDKSWLGLDFDAARNGLYRVEVVFREGGRKIGRFAEYFRVLAAVMDVHLTLNGTAFRPGDTVEGCIENRGTEKVGYGTCGGIHMEVFVAGGWVTPRFEREEEEERGPVYCPALLRILGPGRSTFAGRRALPLDVEPGPYRAVAGGLTTEFQIAP